MSLRLKFNLIFGLTSLLGVPCEVTALDVLEVDYDPFADDVEGGAGRN